jgi:hypothetical protein
VRDPDETVLLRPSQLLVDRVHYVQRPLIQSHVKSLTQDFSPSLFGLGSASCREDGRYYNLDSQHRCEAAKLAGYGEHEFLFQVWRGLSIAEEADLYTKLNSKRVRDTAINAFLVGVEAHYPTNTGVMRILDSCGLRVGATRADGCISAVDALIRIYEGRIKGAKRVASRAAQVQLPTGHLLSRTLTILINAWSTARETFDAILLNAVASALAKHDVAIDGTRLSKLMARDGTPEATIGEIRTRARVNRIGVGAAGLEHIESIYNRKLPEGRRLQ